MKRSSQTHKGACARVVNAWVLTAALTAVACTSASGDEAESGAGALPMAGTIAGTIAGTMAGTGLAGVGASAGAAGASGVTAGIAGMTAGMTAGTAGAMAGAAGITAGAEATAGTAGITAGAAGAAAGAAGMTAGTAGTTAGTGDCPHVQMQGEDFCTIGDSWIQIPGNQVTTLESHLAEAGVIPAGDRFDRREVSGSRLSAIINTYNRQPDNCKVLIMDGGGIDLFTTAAGNEAAVAPVVQMFEEFLDKLAADGFVEHIIYSLYPVIPSTPNLNSNMKPGFSAACEASTVPCVLVDLEPLFMGNYIGGDRTHANQEGGVIIGDAWWQAMQDNCIAQYRTTVSRSKGRFRGRWRLGLA